MNNNQQPQSLYDIYDLLFTPFWRTTPFMVVMGLIVLGTVAWGIWLYWKRYWFRALTPWEEATARLDALQLKITEIDAKTFYTTLTDVLKKYLERRYRYSLSEKTDEEVVAFLSTSELPEPEKNMTQEIFTRAVAYKFGKEQEAAKQMSTDAQTAYTIIKQTIPQETKGN